MGTRSELIDAQVRSPLFDPAALGPLHNLNRRLFQVLVEEWRRGRNVTSEVALLGAKLANLSEDLLWRLARVPICWVDAEFLNEEAWGAAAALSTRAGNALSESPLPRGRTFELAGLTFALAATTAKVSPEGACIMFGMRRTVADAFAGFTVETVHRLGQNRAHWVRPRWYHSPEDWNRMIATAEQPDRARLPPVSLRVLNRMFADLDLAT